MGRCIHDRAREHALSIKSSPSGNLAIYWDKCPCAPNLDETKIVGKLKYKTGRALFEAYCVRVKGEDSCVSALSVHLTEKKFAFLCREPEFVYE